jgi:hypothetical protein
MVNQLCWHTMHLQAKLLLLSLDSHGQPATVPGHCWPATSQRLCRQECATCARYVPRTGIQSTFGEQHGAI